MSRTTTGNNTGVFYKDIISTGALFIKGKRFEDYINELVFKDQLEQDEITEIKLLLEYLDTTGLNSAWLVNNGNTNETLRASITALQTKLANIDTTALTESSVLTNDNRNSVLKTALDTATSDLTALTSRVTAAEGDIDGVETKTRFITEASVSGTGDDTYSNYRTRVGPADGVEKGSALIELNMKNGPANELIGYTIKSNFNNDDYADNESIYSHRDGRLTLLAHTMRMQATEQIRIGNFDQYGDGGASTAINIGGRGQHVNIGCIDSLTQATVQTQIQIGQQSNTAKNTSTRISGNVYLSDARFEDMDKSTPFTLASIVALMSSGPPSWVVSFFSGASSLPYSDIWCMKGGFAGNKNGDIETRNNIMVNELYVVNKDILAIAPKVGFFLAKADYSCTQLIGDHRTQVFEGEIVLRNNNITSSSVDWAFTGANDKCNVVNIGGDSGILIHQGASDEGAPLRIMNTCSGNIELELGDGGTQTSIGGTLSGGNGMSIRSIQLTDLQGNSYTGGMVRMGYYFGGNPTSNPFWGTYQLEVNQYPNRQGIIIAKTIVGDNYNFTFKNTIINGDSINTDGTITGIDVVGTTSISAPTATAGSLLINANYTGNTDARLYKNADDKLMWNGAEVGAEQTLSQVLDNGATASQDINMNSHKISGITTLEGAANGNWNVKEITAGTNISVTTINGSYEITNNAPTQEVAGGTGIQIAMNGTTTTVINNAAVQNLAEGTGILINVDTGTRIATINNNAAVQSLTAGTGITIQVDSGTKNAIISNSATAGGQVARDQLSATSSVGLVPNKLPHYAQNWATQSVSVLPKDIFVSHDGRNCVYIPSTSSGNSYVQYSFDYGVTWTNSNLTTAGFRSICGSMTGEFLYISRIEGSTGQAPNVIYTSRIYVSYNYGVYWTELTLDRTSGAANTWYNRFIDKIRCSSDGSVVMASTFNTTPSSGVANNGVVYISTNAGATWVVRNITAGPSHIVDCCMSANGAIMFAAASGVLGGSTDNGNGGIYRSFDFGATWTKVKNQIAAGAYYFGIIKCDATGRFLLACDQTTSTSAGGGQIQTSDDYGSGWTWFGDEQARGAMAAFVSPGGNLMITLHNPTYYSRLRYSTNYGQTWINAFSWYPAALTLEVIASNHDGSVLLVSNDSDAAIFRSVEERGKLELTTTSTSGELTMTPAFGGGYTLFNNPTTTLWYSGGFEVQTGNPQYKVDFDFLSAGKIDLTQYNIRYEIDCYWSTGTWSYIYPLLSINDVRNIDVPGTNPNVSHDPLSGLTNWTNNINNGTYGGAEVYTQTYNDRFFVGYFPASSTNGAAGANAIQRQRSLIKGTLSLHRRPAQQVGINDASINAKDIYNIFTCDNYSERFYNGMLYLMNSNAQQGIDYGINHQRINGTGIFAAESVWSYNAMGAGTAMASGVSRIGFHLSEGGSYNSTRARAAHYTYRIYRERK